MKLPIADTVSIEQFKEFTDRFHDSLKTGDDVVFFAYYDEVETIYKFETYKLIIIRGTSGAELTGVSFELTFTEYGKNLMLFNEL
ncbi:hypothetical protein KAU11_08615 [Candidatus Babeliales bacterium]|nr:hypothetical protein [Candidatus Babeliales bacterium]